MKRKENGKNTSALIRLVYVPFFFFVVVENAFTEEGRIVREILHSVSLEKTVTQESPDRSISIYLPPGYDKSPSQRFPVVYLLHGIGDTDEEWTRSSDRNDPMDTIQGLMNQGIAEGKFGQMIVVMPDEKTNWLGSMYTNSLVTGNWEDFTTRDLVRYIDQKYRTIARTESRGLAGHSMGGYAAIKLGMKHPNVYSVVYGMNPAALGWAGDLSIGNTAFAFILKAKSFDDLSSEMSKGNLMVGGIVAVALAFSPNPERRPFLADFPFELVNGKLRPSRHSASGKKTSRS
ncbi:esterase family protein [bacterium]|nr:esterase family protein [bacterium]